MKIVSQGFTLIEIVIALFIGSLLTASIYQMLFRTQRSVRLVENVIESDLPLPVLYNQLQRDITGIIIQPTILKPKKKSEIGIALDVLGEALRKRGRKIDDGSVAQEIEIKDLFVSQSGDRHFNMSFITTTGIQPIESGGEIKVQPRLKRVQYVLEPDPYQTQVLRLMYQQSSDLSADMSAQKNPTYELVTHIKSLQVKYYVYEPLEKDKKEQAEKLNLIELNNWNAEEVKKQYKTAIPAFIELSFIFTDPENMEVEQPLLLLFEVPAYAVGQLEEKKEEIENGEDSKDNSKEENNKDNKQDESGGITT